MEKRAASVELSTVGMHELLYGAYCSARVEDNLERLLDLRFSILPFDLDDARAAGEIRAVPRKAGTPIGPYDVLIAGQALARDLVLVTANTREFARVAGLRLEDWTRE
ncbi:PIN domain-containing protein [uncultured Sphingomonas sp.]|uniref:PIN domain-containing protein n=1 Tax=uncultured Sphingomonas sp. TaxID=158754 RepID=UPI0035CACC9F